MVAKKVSQQVPTETIKVRQIGSVIRRPKYQALYLKSLGLSGIGSERELKISHAVLELIKKVSHMVRVIR
jgi:ribosomal protein L30